MLYRFVVVIAVQLLLIFDVLNNRVEIMDGKQNKMQTIVLLLHRQSKTSVHIDIVCFRRPRDVFLLFQCVSIRC